MKDDDAEAITYWPIASVSVKFNVEACAAVSDIDKAEALLRCAQEGLTNALRHGGATEILVTLVRNDVPSEITRIWLLAMGSQENCKLTADGCQEIQIWKGNQKMALCAIQRAALGL